MNTSDKIKSFKNLKPGWHYGKGGPLSDILIKEAIRWHDLMQILGFTNTDAYPCADAIMLTGSFEDSCGDHHMIEVTTKGPKLGTSYSYELNTIEMAYYGYTDVHTVEKCIAEITLSLLSRHISMVKAV